MPVKFFFFFCVLFFGRVSGQSVKMPELLALLDDSYASIDSLLHERGYELAERDGDSALQMRYYTSIEPHAAEPTWVRSISLFEVSDGSRTGRMIQYRTYHVADQDELLSWLLQNQYATIDRFPFGEEKHSIYTNNVYRILVKTGWGKLPNKKRVPYYVWEIGK